MVVYYVQPSRVFYFMRHFFPSHTSVKHSSEEQVLISYRKIFTTEFMSEEPVLEISWERVMKEAVMIKWSGATTWERWFRTSEVLQACDSCGFVAQIPVAYVAAIWKFDIIDKCFCYFMGVAVCEGSFLQGIHTEKWLAHNRRILRVDTAFRLKSNSEGWRGDQSGLALWKDNWEGCNSMLRPESMDEFLSRLTWGMGRDEELRGRKLWPKDPV